MVYQALLFDFDGLMIESETIALRVWQEVVSSLGSVMDDEMNRLLIGKAPGAGATIVRDILDLPIEASDLQQIYWAQRTERMCKEAAPVAGLTELIAYLLEERKQIGVASNSPTTYVEQVLSAINLRQPMGCIVGSDQVGSGKPAPDVYLEAARRLGVAPGEIIVLEDSPTGVLAAIRAGMTCYAIPNPDLLGENFDDAHRVFNSMPALHRHLQNHV